jgi:hypothetical protein
MIIIVNRSASTQRPVKPVEAPPDEDYDYEPAQEKPAKERPAHRGPLSALRGLGLGRLRNLRVKLPAKKKQAEDAPAEDQAPIEELPQDQPKPEPGPPAAGLDLSDERKMWGATFIALAGACAVNGIYLALDYVFREYRTVLGMKMPMAGTLQAASGMSLLILGTLVIVSSAKTGLKLLKG